MYDVSWFEGMCSQRGMWDGQVGAGWVGRGKRLVGEGRGWRGGAGGGGSDMFVRPQVHNFELNIFSCMISIMFTWYNMFFLYYDFQFHI
jgi:hypothetical protein